VAQVVRREHDALRCYVHIGTGNYHSGTSRLYTDLGLFTSSAEISEDVVHLFHYLTGRSLFHQYKKLVIAPIALKKKFLSLIENETENAKKGLPSRIIAKMNSLEEKDICQALYEASRHGVKIDLIVRGVCSLRPGVAGMSENIRVISVIGRFLEHSRIFYFRNAAKHPLDGNFYIGSADWMYRNLAARVEAVVPIENKLLRDRLWEILNVHLEDQRQAWDMLPSGEYVQRRDLANPNGAGSHQKLMNLTLQRDAHA
jgi:polyphosphate kinase